MSAVYITTAEAKKQMNIDASFTTDDAYIGSLCEVAEATVEAHIDDNLTKVAEAHGGVIPTPLRQAMLFLVAHFYNAREAVSFGATPTAVPLTLDYLLSLYKNYAPLGQKTGDDQN